MKNTENCNSKSKILAGLLVEQKTGILAVFCTPPVRAQNTENAAKRKKLQLQMFHVKHFCSELWTPV